MGKAVVRDDSDSRARHFTEILRANPYPAPNGSLHVSQTTLKARGKNAAWELHYDPAENDYDPRDEVFYKAARQAGKLLGS